MAFLEIPVRNDIPSYRMNITLEGRVFILDFQFSVREERWYMGIAKEDGTELLVGIPILTDWPLITRFQDSELPPGDFVAYDTQGEQADPAREDLGDRVLLIYEESA